MPRQGFLFDEQSSRRIVRAVKRIEKFPRNTPQTLNPGRVLHNFVPYLIEGTLDADLDAASAITSPETATLSIFRFDTFGGTYQDTGENRTVVNRDSNFSASAGDFLVAMFINDEWRPISAGPSGGGGPLPGSVVVITGNYTTVTGDRFIIGDTDTAGGSIAVTLGAANAGNEGNTITITNSGVGKANLVNVSSFRDTNLSTVSPALGSGADVTGISDGAGDWWITG